jgi:site-specific DNA recombinase
MECKSTLISLIFPEKIEFDVKKCRTTRINDVLRCILQIYIYLAKNKKGQISKNMSLSRLVEQKGVKSNYFNEDLDIFTTNYLQE